MKKGKIKISAVFATAIFMHFHIHAYHQVRKKLLRRKVRNNKHLVTRECTKWI